METIETMPLRRTRKPKNTDTTRYVTLDNGEHHIMKAVPGYDDLWVNDAGTIITRNGKVINQYTLPPRPNKQTFKCIGINGITTYVHRLVCMAFHGLSDKRFVIHIDGNTLNNHYRNLTWATGLEKHYNCVSLGVFQRGVEKVSKLKAEHLTDINQRIQ